MPPDKSKHAVLDLCTKATLLGNNISVRMLEFLSSVKHQPHGFRNLAQDFLDICRILWAIEAGLSECFRSGQHFPEDMVKELNAKFRQTNADFQVLDHMMFEFLEYENGGVGGKLRKGWRMMFADKSIAKMRDSLSKSRDALRMSALVFQWSLGNASPDASIGTGYTGLAAALDRMAKGRSVIGIQKSKSFDELVQQPIKKPEPQHELPKLPALPPHIPPLSIADRTSISQSDLMTRDRDDHLVLDPQLRRRPSNRSARGSDRDARSTHDSRSIHNHDARSNRDDTRSHDARSHRDYDRDDRGTLSTVKRLERRRETEEIPVIPVKLYHAPGRRTSVSTRTMSDNGHPDHIGGRNGHLTSSNLRMDNRRSGQDDTTSPALTDAETLLDELEGSDILNGGPIKAIRLKADPLTMPRWTPRNAAPANASNLRSALVSAVQGQKHKMIEQLLDRGISPETTPDTHVLREAILNHDTESVRLLLLFGADPNSPDKDGLTPLFSAVEVSFLEGARMLLKYGADPNLCAGPEPESPLAIAVVDCKYEFMQLLLTYGGDSNHSLSNGNTALIAAIGKNTPKRLVDILLEYGADPNGKNREGKTAMFEAITSGGRADIVASLIDHGANPNLPGPKHMLWPSASQPACLKLILARGADTRKAPGILELATSTNNPESVRILIDAGVDVNAKKDGVYTPLCTSIRDNRADLFNMILGAGADPNLPSAEYPCFKCITHFRTQYLPRLIEAGADLSSPPGICEMAVKVNNLEGLKWLLQEGNANANDKNSDGHTALTTAIREGRIEMVEVLLDNGADPTVRGEGWPVCMAVKQPAILRRLLSSLPDPRAFRGVMEMAVVANRLDSVRLLLAAGVSVEDKNGGVFSPLTTAIREDNKEIVRFLLDEGGADPNSPGEHLPIVKAVRRSRGGDDTEIIEMLLNKGADVNKVYRGWNSIMQAVENGDPKMLKLLVGKGGVDLEVKDDAGRTVMDIAAASGWDEAVGMLLWDRNSTAPR